MTEFLPAAQRHGQGMAKKVQEETFQAFTQRSIIFSIPRFMNGGIWGYHLNQWVNTSPTTPLPGLCTSREILLYMTSLSVQRPGSGVVELVLTHWLTWCPQNPPFINFYIEKMDRCAYFTGPVGQFQIDRCKMMKMDLMFLMIRL